MGSSRRPRRVIKKLRSAFPAEWHSDKSNQAEPGQYAVKNQRDWEKLWKAAFGHMEPLPKIPKLPQGKMAIAIFTGKSDKRARISVSAIQEGPGKTIVHWQNNDNVQHHKHDEGKTFQSCLLKLIDKSTNKVVFSEKPSIEQTPPAAAHNPQRKGPRLL